MIYLLPGRKSKLNCPLGNNIVKLGYDVCGREIRNEFELYRISKQIDIICQDIKNNFWGEEFKLIGRSYGGYLMMHALIEFLPDPYPGKVLLLSPVLGASTIANGHCSRPPRSKKILEFSKAGKLNELNIEIHTGNKDIGCEYKLAKDIFSNIENGKLFIVENAPHHLNDEYTNKVLKKFLCKKG
jgi:alpha-beta hydrolase superfamily lysophospholipase